MMSTLSRISFALAGLLAIAFQSSFVLAQEDAAAAAVRQRAEQLVTAFNAGKTDDVAGYFMPRGELIDEAGTVYQGTQEIKGLLNAFFKEFPGAKLALNVESIRLVGPVAIDEGTRSITTADGEARSQFRYIAVWTNVDKEWKLASFRDFADDPIPTPHDNLEPLAWLVGEWVNEGTDADVAISYRWSDDGNYLLGEFDIQPVDGPQRKSTQRIGWDPTTGTIRSWLFDADGGFAEGKWTMVEDGIVAKSESVNSDGTTSSATMTITPTDNDHYSIAGSERIVAGAREPDFELTVTRRPPKAGN